MTLPTRRLLWAGIFGQDAEAVDPGLDPGGIVLFARNLDPDPGTGPARCFRLVRDLQARWAGAAPLGVAIDQEGGSVSRLRTWVGATPSLRDVWVGGGVAACRRWGALWGQGLRLLGCNVDFAPVADRWDPSGRGALRDRAASDDPLDVARAAGAFLAGLERTGVRGCLKHYPGLGGTVLDSHVGLPEQADPAAWATNRAPFRMLAQADRLVMVAHLLGPDTGGLPASLCRAVVADNPWGIRARWLPDDLEMGGCRDWAWDDRARLALEAGHLALLVCQTPAGIEACARSADQLPAPLAGPALARFEALRRALPAGPETFDAGAWRAWVAAIRAETARNHAPGGDSPLS